MEVYIESHEDGRLCSVPSRVQVKWIEVRMKMSGIVEVLMDLLVNELRPAAHFQMQTENQLLRKSLLLRL